jgi:ABC-type transporter Mla subunit MlaD
MTASRLIGLGCAFVLLSSLARAAALPLIVEVDNSRGLRPGDAVTFEGRRIGEVTGVGFGERDTVEIRVTVDDKESDRVLSGGMFVVNEAIGDKRPNVEYFVVDPHSAPAEANRRMPGARSVAEVWLRRGRIGADELSRTMSQGVEQFRRALEELRRSPEWAKFKDQVARLSAQLTLTGAELARLLNEELPKLQKELDDLYAEYQKELGKARPQPAPTP